VTALEPLLRKWAEVEPERCKQGAHTMDSPAAALLSAYLEALAAVEAAKETT
jgi:hypothetical protein